MRPNPVTRQQAHRQPAPRQVALALLLCALASSQGCIEREGRPVTPCTQVTVAQSIQVDNVDKVDLLFMVDNSNSMATVQVNLTAQFPRLIRILVTGDFDESGETGDNDDDFDPVRDLNFGVITSDMGTGGYTVPTCANSDFGDDGILQTRGRLPGCQMEYPSFLNFRIGRDMPEQFARDAACVATLGTGGCGLEQQLEAPLKALTPSAPTAWTAPDFVRPGTPDAPRGLNNGFFRNSPGHGDGANAGFARENSVLALILVTDEEDCSAFDPDYYEFDSAIYGGREQINLRCFLYPEGLHPIERFVNGYVQLRTRPGLLVFGGITGIPPDLAPRPGERVDYERILADPRMQGEVDPERPQRVRSSCNTEVGSADPPRRIVQVAQGLEERGAGVTLQSICSNDFRDALSEVIRLVKSALGAACLPRPLNVDASGQVSCDVIAIPPTGQDCPEGSSQKLDERGDPVFEGMRPVCVIPQLVPASRAPGAPPPSGTGWYYDNFTADGEGNCASGAGQPFQRIAFTSQPVSGTEVRLECFLAVQGGGGDVTIGIGSFCDPDAPDRSDDNLCASARTPENNDDLGCDPVTRSCGVRCDNDAQCRSAGLIGFVCDPRPLSEIDPQTFPGNSTPHNFCVNPTCG